VAELVVVPPDRLPDGAVFFDLCVVGDDVDFGGLGVEC
jgi:hypothetical protein